MTNFHGISTPLDLNVVLFTAMSPTLEEAKQKTKGIPYLAGVGSLMYASMATHPDITFATNSLSQFNSNSSLPHWTALQHILWYLKQTRDFVLTLSSEIPACLISYTNSNYAGCIDTQWSTSGYIFTLGRSAISWSSKWQPIMTTSSCKAKYIASCHATKEAMWLHRLLEILSHKKSTTVIHSNNMGSIALTKYPSFHTRSKHINIQFHYTHEHVNAKDVSFKYLPTAAIPANIMTKPCHNWSTILSLIYSA